MATQDPSAGRAIIKVFDAAAAPANGYNYNTDGEVFAYGLRNTIGFVPDPSGVYWGVENSGDVSYLLFDVSRRCGEGSEGSSWVGGFASRAPADSVSTGLRPD